MKADHCPQTSVTQRESRKTLRDAIYCCKVAETARDLSLLFYSNKFALLSAAAGLITALCLDSFFF